MSDITFNPNADPGTLETWTTVGPDGQYLLMLDCKLQISTSTGPWNAITQAVSWPMQVCC